MSLNSKHCSRLYTYPLSYNVMSLNRRLLNSISTLLLLPPPPESCKCHWHNLLLYWPTETMQILSVVDFYRLLECVTILQNWEIIIGDIWNLQIKLLPVMCTLCRYYKNLILIHYFFYSIIQSYIDIIRSIWPSQ